MCLLSHIVHVLSGRTFPALLGDKLRHSRHGCISYSGHLTEALSQLCLLGFEPVGVT